MVIYELQFTIDHDGGCETFRLTDYHYVICSRYLTTHLLLVIYELQFTIDHDSGCETFRLNDYHHVICSRYHTTHLLLVIYELQFTIDLDSGCETFRLTDYHHVICSRYLTTHLLLVIYELQFTIDLDSGCETLGLLTIITSSAVGISLHTSYWSFLIYSSPLIMTVAVKLQAYYLYDICSRYLTAHLLLVIYELQFTIDHDSGCKTLGLLTIITTSAVVTCISLHNPYWSYYSDSSPLIITVAVKL